MEIRRTKDWPIRREEDVVATRQLLRAWMVEMRFSLVAQTKTITAASEIARNTLVHGGGGTVRLEHLDSGTREGVRLIFEDSGKGIADIGQAMTDGYTTGSGLGLGLGGAKRLVGEFEIVTQAGAGTRVTITQWK